MHSFFIFSSRVCPSLRFQYKEREREKCAIDGQIIQVSANWKSLSTKSAQIFFLLSLKRTRQVYSKSRSISCPVAVLALISLYKVLLKSESRFKSICKVKSKSRLKPWGHLSFWPNFVSSHKIIQFVSESLWLLLDKPQMILNSISVTRIVRWRLLYREHACKVQWWWYCRLVTLDVSCCSQMTDWESTKSFVVTLVSLPKLTPSYSQWLSRELLSTCLLLKKGS